MEKPQREEALAQVEPDAFNRVELGAVGRQDDEGDARRHDEVTAHVPAGTVEHQDEMRVRRPGGRDMIEEDLHRGGVHGRQHQRDVVAGGGPDRGEDVGPEVAELLDARRALAAAPPAVADPALVADPRLVGKPQLDPLVGMLRRNGGYLFGKPPFLKAACASASRWGWKGRAFWREKPSLLSTRVMLDGW